MNLKEPDGKTIPSLTFISCTPQEVLQGTAVFQRETWSQRGQQRPDGHAVIEESSFLDGKP